MNWDALGAIGELIGGVVVVFSLIYVGVQIKQSRALARATAQRDLYQSYQQYLYKISERPDLIRQGLHDFSSLSNSDAISFNMLMAPFINHLDQTIRMYKNGFETKDNVDLYGDICMSLLVTPGGRDWWEIQRHSFVIEGRNYIEERFGDPDSLPAPLHETVPYWGPGDA